MTKIFRYCSQSTVYFTHWSMTTSARCTKAANVLFRYLVQMKLSVVFTNCLAVSRLKSKAHTPTHANRNFCISCGSCCLVVDMRSANSTLRLELLPSHNKAICNHVRYVEVLNGNVTVLWLHSETSVISLHTGGWLQCTPYGCISLN